MYQQRYGNNVFRQMQKNKKLGIISDPESSYGAVNKDKPDNQSCVISFNFLPLPPRIWRRQLAAGADGGTRTHKPKHWFLRPACLPIPPHPLISHSCEYTTNKRTCQGLDYFVFIALTELIIAITATPTSAKTAAAIGTSPSALRTRTPSFTDIAKTIF